MNNASAQYDVFASEVAQTREVWTIRDAGGFPAPKNSEGIRAHPFWSSLSRVQRIVKNVHAYAGFQPVEISWEEFRDKWLPGMERDGYLVGANWDGPRATGFDVKPNEVRQRIEYELSASQRNS